MEIEKKPRRKREYRLEQMDNELLLYHPAETQVMYCNETASLIWQLCDGQRTRKEIVALLVEAYPDGAERIAGDVQLTLEQFLTHGAIEYV